MQMKAIIYSRCSTSEERQDVENQLRQLRDYCTRQGWEYEEVSEYASGSKSVPPVLTKLLKKIKNKEYDIFLVWNLSRFSRLHPSKTSKMMDYVSKHCRFVSMQDNIDSEDDIKWLIIKPIFQYMAWIYSQNLSENVKMGMKRKKEEIKNRGYTISKKTGKKITSIGRPKGSKDKKQRNKKGYYKRYEEDVAF